MNKKKALKIIYELIIRTEEQVNGVYETEDFSDVLKAYLYIEQKLKGGNNENK